MTFRIGQKVVCVHAVDEGWGHGIEILPTVGEVYTIRSKEEHPTGFYVRLHEIHNTPMPYGNGMGEAQFTVRAFRPLVERKTSIEIFERMLTPATPKHEREKVGGR
jgi:hypothetical protein